MKQFLLKLAIAAIASIVLCGTAAATTIQVDSTSGDVDATSCTLIDAFEAAYYRQARGTCPVGTGDDVIVLPAGVTINVDHQYDGAGAVLPYVTSNLLLLGNGSTITSTVGGSLIVVNLNGILSVNGVTFQGIRSFDQDGAAIHVNGVLNVTNSVFVGNGTKGYGGAIYSEFGAVDIEDSVFQDNSAQFGGGAIYSNKGSVIVRSSYFTRNTGTAISSDNLYVVNSTFRENGEAIDISAFGSGSVSYSTFEENGAAVGLIGNSLLLANNLFSHPVGGYPIPNCGDFSGSGGMVTIGQNLSDDFSCPGATVVADRNAFAFGDPISFRGLNTVLPIRPGSAAIGPTSCFDASGHEIGDDQRGVARHWHCSLGAFEFDEGDYAYTRPPAFQPADILVSAGNSIFELKRNGQLVRTVYPSPHYGVYGLRGIDAVGLTAVGMFLQQEDAHLQVYAALSDTWTDFFHAGWYAANAATEGQITHVGDRWFLSGYERSADADYIIAFDQNGFLGSATSCPSIHALQTSREGSLYVICDAAIDVFDPQTLSKTRTIDTSTLSTGNTTRAGAVDKSGNIFLSETDGRIYRIDETGHLLASTNCFNDGTGCGFSNSSMAVSDDGKLFIGSWTSVSSITVLDTDFTTVSSIPTGFGPSIDAIWVAALPGDEIFDGNFE